MSYTASFASHTARIFSEVADNAVPSALVSSWRRCVTLHGLTPDGVLRPHRLEEHAIVDGRAESEELVRAAAEPIEQLIKSLPGSDLQVFLCDAKGMVIDTRTFRSADLWDRPSGLWIGTDFSEDAAGTNGVGTVLREKRPMTIAGGQHFHASNTVAVCSGAPVYRADGTLCGCLDITSSAARNDPVTNALMLAAAVEVARRIELRMFANAHAGTSLVLASRTVPNTSALLAVDRHGAVVGATRAARTLLHLKDEDLDGLSSAEQLWGLGDAADLSCVAAERRAIEAALAKHRGNVSAAAKAVGISRSTFYRKVTDYRIESHTRPPRGDA